ncbi:MAG: Maf family nucleotide pyrophosphatase [Gallionellaceae bacterium]|jgi:septum formation protein|nr:Maf family nucleotide pyrophosphatase [Gallionellaceae bacterium]
MNTHPRIYLASQSPRRRELLRQIRVDFEVLLPAVGVDETPRADESPLDYVQRVCNDKVHAGWEELQRSGKPVFPVLAADTTVALGSDILGKPRDQADAADMLHRLSGQRHQVMTAIALRLGQRSESRVSVTTVDFIELGSARIQHYLDSGEWHDKAGAYAIQGLAGAFARRLDGSYSGVMGLPLFETAELLRAFDYPSP